MSKKNSRKNKRVKVRTLDEIEAFVCGLKEWKGTVGPQYSIDGKYWVDYWDKEYHGAEHPKFAAAMVVREGLERQTQVFVSWAESFPDEPALQEQWLKKPATMLGARALRTAYARAFRDRVEVVWDEPEVQTPQRDWEAEIRGAASAEELHRVWADARNYRARTGKLERIFMEKQQEFGVELLKPDRQGPREPGPVIVATRGQTRVPREEA